MSGIITWLKEVPKNSFSETLQGYIIGFKDFFLIYRKDSESLFTNEELHENFKLILYGYLLRAAVANRNFGAAKERIDEFFEEYGWNFLNEWEAEYIQNEYEEAV